MNTTFANHDNAELGLVLVSTGVQKWEAICGAGPHNKPYFKIKRRRKFSVRCLVAAVGLKSLTA